MSKPKEINQMFSHFTATKLQNHLIFSEVFKYQPWHYIFYWKQITASQIWFRWFLLKCNKTGSCYFSMVHCLHQILFDQNIWKTYVKCWRQWEECRMGLGRQKFPGATESTLRGWIQEKTQIRNLYLCSNGLKLD